MARSHRPPISKEALDSGLPLVNVVAPTAGKAPDEDVPRRQMSDEKKKIRRIRTKSKVETVL